MGSVSPNPLVGAVLVYGDRVIGEGFHEVYGGPHAEVNCINSVSEADRDLISRATLYVSLEPCAHFGKTPPCSDLIIAKNIPEVVIGCGDIFDEVNGKGIEKLEANGVKVVTGVLQEKAIELNKRFFTFHREKRPYVILKWAQTADGFIGKKNERVAISHDQTNKVVHRWRTEEDAIMVGTNTALTDNPHLTARLWPGRNPVRIVLDKELRLPATLNLFDKKVRTIVFNGIRDGGEKGIQFIKIGFDKMMISQILSTLYSLQIQSVIVEGGQRLLQSFIDGEFWDEARVITNEVLHLALDGGTVNLVEAPNLKNACPTYISKYNSDTIKFYRRRS